MGPFGLERLLLYVLRPALSLKQLTYKPEQDLVRYRPAKGTPRLARVIGPAQPRPEESIFVAGAGKDSAARENRP